jgi:hypothetical protein
VELVVLRVKEVRVELVLFDETAARAGYTLRTAGISFVFIRTHHLEKYNQYTIHGTTTSRTYPVGVFFAMLSTADRNAGAGPCKKIIKPRIFDQCENANHNLSLVNDILEINTRRPSVVRV